jgi:SAM-dependent methyltransferase
MKMAHANQIEFCKKIKNKFPDFFKDKKVLDVGSLDINGNNRYLFENCEYTGIDIGPGKNVDIVSLGHKFDAPDESYDFIISTECFEHDMYYELTIKNIYRMLKSKGFFLFTCATTGRREHGTKRTSPRDAPLLTAFDKWSDYYKNLTADDIKKIYDLDKIFSKHEFEINKKSHDLYFYGIKK